MSFKKKRKTRQLNCKFRPASIFLGPTQFVLFVLIRDTLQNISNATPIQFFSNCVDESH